ncbi:MAG: hypothetical protein M0Z28_21075 [Rhodospirillales bacterium]|nr:hypothetical protein [Rhodospirillales bacterium]
MAGDPNRTYYGAPIPRSKGPHPDPLADAMASRHCVDCRHFHKGYRLQGMKVPPFCNAGFCSVSHDDPACKDFAEKDHADAL